MTRKPADLRIERLVFAVMMAIVPLTCQERPAIVLDADHGFSGKEEELGTVLAEWILA